jgi:tRNA(Arg) A34 adenosine deaminase TadA
MLLAMSHTETRLVITVPGWVDDAVAAASGPFEAEGDRMDLAIALSRHNVEHGGGPFGAVVFSGNRVVAAGVNRVLDSGFSIAHAEIVALMRAQSVLAARPTEFGGPYALVTSTEPCCQCFGAIVWSGVTRLSYGAVTSDAEAVGFDEGPKPDRWVTSLEDRGISVIEGVHRDEARAVLDEYARRGGTIYGIRHPPIGS